MLQANRTVRNIELNTCHADQLQPSKHRGLCAIGARCLWKILCRVEDERRSFIIEKHGTLRAVLLSINDYVKLAAPEPEVLKIIGEESKRKGTDNLTSRQIDVAIQATRA